MPRCCANFWNGSVIGPGIVQQARSIHAGAGMPCGGPCMANSGITTSFAGASVSTALVISPSALSILASMIDHAARAVAAFHRKLAYGLNAGRSPRRNRHSPRSFLVPAVGCTD